MNFTKGVIIIFVILALAFLSQQVYFRSVTKSYLYSKDNTKKGISVGDKLTGWFQSNLYSKLSDEAGKELDKRETMLKEAINDQKDSILENSFTATKKFIAEKVLNILGVKPEDLCK